MSAPAYEVARRTPFPAVTVLVSPLAEPTPGPNPFAKVAIVIVAYEAASTIATVLDRIPRTDRPLGRCDPRERRPPGDRTAVIAEWGKRHPAVPLTVVAQPQNLGYGGNQKYCYRWAISRGFEQAITGARRRPVRAGARRRDGAAVAGRWQRGGVRLADAQPRRRSTWWHADVQVRRQQGADPLPEHASPGCACRSGTAATARTTTWPRSPACRSTQMSDGFDFDTEIILQLADRKATITRDPDPHVLRRRGACRVNGVRYAFDVDDRRREPPPRPPGERHLNERVT